MKDDMQKILHLIFDWLSQSGRSNEGINSSFKKALQNPEAEVSIRIFQKEDKLEIYIGDFLLAVKRLSAHSVSIGAMMNVPIGHPDWHGYSETILNIPAEINTFYHQLRHLYALGRKPEFRGSFMVYESYYDLEKQEGRQQADSV